MGFIFIPIISIQNNLNLSQIALIFAVMRLPYIIDVFTGAFADRYNKKKFILLVLFFMSFLFALLGLKDGFVSTLTISLGIAFGLALLRPAISGLISDYTRPEHEGKITGIQHCVSGLGSAIGALVFGGIASIFSMESGFIGIGIFLFLFALRGIIRKFHISERI
ncbi:MAG: MFS transporter [bacterium]